MEPAVSDSDLYKHINSKEYRLNGDNRIVIGLEDQLTNIPSNVQDDETDSTISSTLDPVAPDGGYGWIIVLASFLIHFICDGISFSFGIMFSEIQGYFKATKTLSGVVGSIFLSIPLLSGPFAGALTDIYDCRYMTIVGGFLAAGGVLLSFFASSIWHFLISFAFITGIGLSFCFNTAIVAVTYYFQKRRAVATGIAVCGSGAGTFFLAPCIEMINTKFGWHTSLMFMAGVLFLLVGCGFMIKDLEWPHDTTEYKRKKFIEKAERRKLRLTTKNAGDQFSVLTKNFPHIGSVPRRAVSQPAIPTYVFSRLQIADHFHILSADDIHDPEQIREQVNFAVDESSYKPVLKSYSAPHHVEINTLPGSSYQPCSNENSFSAICDSSSRKCFGSGDSLDLIVTNKETCNGRVYGKSGDTGNIAVQNVTKEPLLHDKAQGGASTFTSHAVSSLHVATSLSAAQSRVPAANILNFRWKFEPFDDSMYQRIPSAPVIYYRRKLKGRTFHMSKMWESFLKWLSSTKLVLKVPEFSVFLISTFILYVFFDIPYVNFPEYAVEKLNVTETEASYLISSIGLTNMVSMLLCGIIADWTRTNRYIIHMYGVFITLAGLCVALTPFTTSYMQLMALCVGFGFFISANYTLASVITLRVLCLYDFQTGYGILCLVEGLGNLIGPALIGFIRDNISGYDNIFLLGGMGTIISGFMVIAVDTLMRVSNSGDAKILMKHNKSYGIRTKLGQTRDGTVSTVNFHPIKISENSTNVAK